MNDLLLSFRQQPVATAVVLVSLAMVLVSVAILHVFVPGLRAHVLAQQPPGLHVKAFDAQSAIARENQQRGTSAWEINPGANMTYIEGYAGNVSAQPGDTIPLYISSVAPIKYTLDVYRIGWYQGLGGRLMASRHNLTSVAQGYSTPSLGLQACSTCTTDPTTHLVAAHWQHPLTLTIGQDWLSGAYLVKLHAANNAESYIFFVVRADASSTAALASFPVNTYQAYNGWGNWSLYDHFDLQKHQNLGNARAYKVSFDRPYVRSAGAGDFLSWDIHTVRWLERSSLDVSYTTNIDVDAHPATIQQHRIFMSIGHDEYWTTAMRNGIQTARDQGVSLAFLGANDAYWHVRLESDQELQPARTLVSYKVLSNPTKDPTTRLKNDPAYPSQPDEVTSNFRDPVLHQPESELLGLQYKSLISGHNQYHPDWVVMTGQLDPLALGTGLTPGEHINGGLLGYEFDTVDSGNSPPGLVLLASSPVITYHNERVIAGTSYYRASSGALVFDAGSIWWGWGLDELSPYGAYQANVLHGNVAISNLMTNIINAMFSASLTPPTTATAQP